MGRAELVRTLVHAAAASDDAGDAGQVLVDARTAVRVERDARSLGYLLNQCARALNGIAKSCREQDIDSENLAEALEGVRLDLAAVSDVNGNLEATSQGKAIFQPGQCASTIQVNTVSPSRAARIRSVRICGDGSGGSQDGDQPDRRDGYAQGDGRAPQLLGDGTQMRDGPACGREVLEGRRRDGGRALCKAQRLRQMQG